MNQCAFKQGLLENVSPIIEGLHSENDRMVVTCAIMALLKYFNTGDDYLKDVTINGNTIIFTKKDNSTVNIQLPIDEYVNNVTLNGNILTLHRNQGQDLTVDLSSITTSVDTSKFFSSCQYDSISHIITFYNIKGDLKKSIDLSGAFKDGMLTNVQFANNKLTFTWNSQSGKQPLSVDLSSLVTSDTFIDSGELTQNQTNSHYIINLNYNTDKSPISIDLNAFRDDIVNSFPFVPGYYWSASKPNNGSLSTVPEYIGTDLTSTVPYDFGAHRYIVYSNDGVTYTLINEFKEPPVDKHILMTSYHDSVAKNDRVSVPGGFLFLPFMKQDGRSYYAHSLCITDLSVRTTNELVSVNNNQKIFNGDTVLKSGYTQNSVITTLIDNMVTNTGLFPNSNYKLKIFYNKIFTVDTNYPNYSTYKLFKYTSAEKTEVDDPNGDATVKATVLQKSKLCNFINPKNRIELKDNITLPDMSLRTNTLYTIEEGAITENSSGYTLNTIFNINDDYYMIFGYQVVDNNDVSIPFANSNTADNCYMYFVKKNYAPASAIASNDFIRDVNTFRSYVEKNAFKIYKKTYEVDANNQQKSESIIWTAVTDNTVPDSDIIPGTDQKFLLTDPVNWVSDVTTATDNTNTNTADINNLNFIWSVFVGYLLRSKNINTNNKATPFNAAYYDTIGWNNKFKIYSLGTSGMNKANICIYVNNLYYNSTTKELESVCTVNFDISSNIAHITGSVNLNIGSYNYLERNGEIYNFGADTNLENQYEQYRVVHPKVTVSSILASGYKFTDPNTIYRIKG